MNLTKRLNRQTCRNPIRHGLTLALLAATPLLAGAAETINWSAFNDATPSSATHPNATTYGLTSSGPLKDIATGSVLPVGAVIANTGVATAGTMNAPATGTPAYTNPGDAHNHYVLQG